MLRDDSSKFDGAIQILDLAVSAAIFLALLSIPGMLQPSAREGLASLRLIGFAFVAALLWPVLLQTLDVYAIQRRPDFSEAKRRLLASGVAVMVILSGWGWLISAPVSPLFAPLTGLVQLAVLFVVRLALRQLRQLAQGRERYTRNVMIVGSGPRARYVHDIIDQNPQWSMHIIGFVDNGTPPQGVEVPIEQIFKVADMDGLLNDQVVDEVIVACPRSMLSTIIPVVDACSSAGIPITLLSDLFGDYLPPPQVTRFGALPALSFAPVHHNAVQLLIKRGLDVTGAAVGLSITAPIILVSAMLIKLTSNGPIFFRQVRCGLNGRHFVMLKLRTMSHDAEDRRYDLAALNEMDGPVFKITRDPRITAVGRILRRYSIDEFPQFWNVLVGDMSLVGPRPPVPVEVAEYETFERRRLSMRPGLTCLWQVSGRNAIGFEDWVRLDLEYIDTWSLGNDLRIMLRTFPAVLSGDGAS